jgi:hypothetical protein
MENCNIKTCELIPSIQHKEICETQKLSLSKTRPGIKKIIDVKINLIIKSNKTLVFGIRHIEVIYASEDNCIHNASYDIPFKIPIAIKDNYVNMKKVLVGLTYLSVKILNSRAICITSKIFAIAITEKYTLPKESIIIDEKPIKRRSRNLNDMGQDNCIGENPGKLFLLLAIVFIFSRCVNSSCIQQ